MAKKKMTLEKTKNKKNQKINPVDCIPKLSQQPRSSPPKRRTDFSAFWCSPSSLSNPGSSPGSSSGEVRLSNVPASSLLERRMTEKQFPDDTVVRCNDYQEGRPVCSSEYSDVLVLKVDSAVRDGLDASGNRDAGDKKIDNLKMSESTAPGSPVSDSNFIAITPGIVVWARTAGQVWWPAEIMEERSTLSDMISAGHVLVHFFGNQLTSAWIDPMTDLSTFEDSFEERSSNPSKDFQEALKQALQRKEQVSSCKKLSPDRPAHSGQQDHSSDKWTSSTSSRTRDDDILERRRGKRERKRKVHFDEVTCPLKSERKIRRLKIMRYLGLAAPIGSPF